MEEGNEMGGVMEEKEEDGTGGEYQREGRMIVILKHLTELGGGLFKEIME